MLLHKKGLLFGVTFLFTLSVFFFLSIGSVSLAVYVIYRMINEKEKWQDAIRYIRNMIFGYLLGLGTDAFIFIPAVWGFLESNCTGIKQIITCSIHFKKFVQCLKIYFCLLIVRSRNWLCVQ